MWGRQSGFYTGRQAGSQAGFFEERHGPRSRKKNISCPLCFIPIPVFLYPLKDMHSPSRWLLRQAVVSCLVLGTLHAQPLLDKTANTASGVPDARLERSDLQTVIGMARAASVPPEFAADVLITLVESGLIPDRRTQRNLLEEAPSQARPRRKSRRNAEWRQPCDRCAARRF